MIPVAHRLLAQILNFTIARETSLPSLCIINTDLWFPDLLFFKAGPFADGIP
jgi:hypothetical protein